MQILSKNTLLASTLLASCLLAQSSIGGIAPLAASGPKRRVTATIDTSTLLVSAPVVEKSNDSSGVWTAAPTDSAQSEFRKTLEEPLRPVVAAATAMMIFDCNSNGIPDTVDISNGATDSDADLVIDTCEYNIGDLNLNGVIDSADTSILLGWWSISNPLYGDLNFDGVVDAMDLGIILGRYGVPVY
jgi:hypothetical protein